MHRKSLVLLTVALLLLSAGLTAQVRSTKPNDLTFELGGRCLLYSLSYQRMIVPRFGLEIGASYIGAVTAGAGAGVFFLNGGGRFYLMDKNAAPFIATGIVWLSAGADAGPFEDASSTVYYYVQPGFEIRMASGFVFRAGVYFLIKSGVAVWPGLQAGIAF